MVLVLKAAEVAPLIDMTRAIALTEQVFAEFGRQKVSVHAPFHLNVENGALRVVSGALMDTGRMGVRLSPTRGAADGHLAVLYGTDGTLLSVMGYPFGTLRTGATVAVSVKHMAREDARRFGLIGTGTNALSLMRGAMAVRAVGEFFVYSRDAERRQRFCVEAAAELGIAVHPVGAPRQAVSGMDVVLTSTSNRQPLFPFAWLDRGTHLSSMGPISELDPSVLLETDRLVVTSKDHEENYYIKTPPFPLVELIAAGRLRWDDIVELGDVMTGRVPGRASADEITVFHESQGGFGDVMFASAVYAEARRRGLGQDIAF